MLKTSWNILIELAKTGKEQMDKDLSLFDAYQIDLSPILRIFSFLPKCISYGYAQDIDLIVNKPELLDGWDMVKRPTGGGLVFHQEKDLSFSLIAAKDLFGKDIRPKQIFSRIMPILMGFLNAMGIKADFEERKTRNPIKPYCFDYPSDYEIVYQGKKIVGYAQKHCHDKVLIQGTIFVERFPQINAQQLKLPINMEKYSCMQEILPNIPSTEKLSEVLLQSFTKQPIE